MSCSNVSERNEVAKLATALKKSLSSIPLVLGGYEASLWYKEILGNTQFPIDEIPAIDFVVVGPGQPVINNLLLYLSDSTKYDLPKGVATRINNKVVFRGLPRFDYNRYSVADFTLLPKIKIVGRLKPLDFYSYVGNPHAGKLEIILGSKNISYFPITTSYGCGFNCSFCDADKKLRRYKLENVIRMIDAFESLYGIDYIDFMDNNFGGGNQDSRFLAFDILAQIKKSGYQIGFSNGLTFESMAREDHRLIRQFADYGNVRHIAFPCENGNDRILRMIRKPHDIELVKKTLVFSSNVLQKTNREGFFIGGFPKTSGKLAETPQELENTYHFIRYCLEKGFLHQAIFLTLSPVTKEYRFLWRKLYPNASFEHCLFSRKTGIWPYPNVLLDEMHEKVKLINEQLGRLVTRKL